MSDASQPSRSEPGDRAFGQFIRLLRQARGLGQQELAEKCGLSPDTIRRLEYGGFSPSLMTLRKVCAGLGLTMATLFEAFEMPDNDTPELVGLLRGRGRKLNAQVLRLVRLWLATLADAAAGDE